jgi:hypothetical protein
MRTRKSPITPLEQGLLVQFAGRQLPAVRLPGNSIAVVLHTCCEMLGLQHSAQVHRVLDDPVIADCLILALVETNGGPQAAYVLTSEALLFWLAGIQPARVAPANREVVLAFQKEAVEMLRRHFIPQVRKAHTAPFFAKEQAQSRVPSGTSLEALLSFLQMLAAVLAELVQRNQAIRTATIATIDALLRTQGEQLTDLLSQAKLESAAWAEQLSGEGDFFP